MIKRLPTHPVVRSLLVIGIAFVYGWGTGRIEAPKDPADFWVGNLGLAAGAWAVRKVSSAAVIGVLSVTATVAGFYNLPRILTSTPAMPWDSSRTSATLDAVRRWLSLMLWSNAPWLTIGVVIGVVMGVLGHRWATHRSLVGAYVAAAALCAEPLVYVSGMSARLGISYPYSMTSRNLLIWCAEWLIGVAVLATTFRAHRRQRQAGRHVTEPQPQALAQ